MFGYIKSDFFGKDQINFTVRNMLWATILYKHHGTATEACTILGHKWIQFTLGHLCKYCLHNDGPKLKDMVHYTWCTRARVKLRSYKTYYSLRVLLSQGLWLWIVLWFVIATIFLSLNIITELNWTELNCERVTKYLTMLSKYLNFLQLWGIYLHTRKIKAMKKQGYTVQCP